MNWTEKHFKQLQKEGKIRGYRVPEKSKSAPQLPKPVAKAIAWLKWNLQYWANDHALHLEEEFRFHRERRYRSDFAFPALKILIEYEGGVFLEVGGHNSASGIQRDIDKYALAAKEGWTVVRLTAMNYKTVLSQLNELVK